MLNLWIGLCKGDPGLPDAITTLGFRQHVIEQTIRNDDGSVCVPELICFSKKESHTLIFEWKSGKNSVDDQLARYNQLNSVSLTGLLPGDETQAVLGTILICGPFIGAAVGWWIGMRHR